MQFIKQLLDVRSWKKTHLSPNPKPLLKVGILGTGKIGVDLLIKVRRSTWLECVVFAGRNLESDGMRYAAALGIPVSDQGLATFHQTDYRCDIVFDATSAASHLEHAPVFAKLGIFAIDMTPSQIGECCVPALGMEKLQDHHNISMISCGGQSSIPMAQVLYRHLPFMRSLSVVSRVSADSIGPATLANIKEYYANTKAGLRKYTGDMQIQVELLVDNETLTTPMITTLVARTEGHVDLEGLGQALKSMAERVQLYVPGYQLLSGPSLCEQGVCVEVQVEGAGDYLPRYAGNLDIINCAALAVAEDFARTRIRAGQLVASRNSVTEWPLKQLAR